MNFSTCKIEHTQSHLRMVFEKPCRVLSSAVLNGGFFCAEHILNLKVDENYKGEKKEFPSPGETILSYCQEKGWSDKCVGMMTSALMNSFRHASRSEQGTVIQIFLTAGVANAKRAGEHAEWRRISEFPRETGTVNIIAITNAALTPSAMAEAIINITEAKTAVFQDLGVKSYLTGQNATGTGTDSVAVASTDSGPRVDFCGKHTLFGEMLSLAVMEALKSSLAADKAVVS